MNPERWQQIENLYHAARQRNPRERTVFLDGACREDSDLRRKVESLLAEDAPRNRSGDSVTFTVDAGSAHDPGTLAAGNSWLGPYQLEGSLGAGGMGQVYRGRDTRLSRPVAIKVLTSGSVDRFIQEARAASALNHPNIVTIYDVGETAGVSYIVMELIEGQTLRQAMAGGPVPVPKLLAIAVQIADALAAAHSKGIFHRDLKPANIMLSAEGRAKILDFGLAKLGGRAGEGLSAAQTEHSLTQPGTILGTFGYMSPEQARGESGDFRSDQFSFGAVLYEMATGRRAFGGSTQVDALAAVIRDQPEPIGRINPQTPAPLQWVVERCLAKSPRDRYGSTHELLNELSAMLGSVSQPVPAPAATPHNLPAQRTALVGRDRELEGARQLILQPQARLVTLTGPGGIGKTRLAVELGRKLLEEFPGGVYFVPLDRITDADLVSSELANTLGIRHAEDRAIVPALLAHVRAYTAPTLLLLDNFEHVIAASPLVTDLLSTSDQLKIAITSRAALRLYGEYEFPVPPLELPDGKTAPVELLAKSPAVALFLERATALRAGGDRDEAQIRMVAEICARLDGLPLSIELAAARTRVLPLTALLERVRDPLQLLAGGPRDLPMRQRALRATLDWSHNLLDPEQQKLFRRMSVFVGGATHEAIEAVCNAKEDLDIDLLDAIESLVDNSLVRRTGADLTEPRFVMLETMREYGLAKLAEAEEESYTRKAHAAYFVVLAEEAEPALMGGGRQQMWFARMDEEIGNNRAAMDWLTASGQAEWGLRMASALGFYWQDRALSQETHDRFLKLLDLPGAAARTILRAKALLAAADMAQFSGRPDDRLRHFAEGLEILDELGDPLGLLRALTHSAVAEKGLGNYETARQQFERTVEIARALGDPVGLAGALSNLADIAKIQGEYELARLLHLETSRLFEQVGNRIGMAWSLSHQADLARQQQDVERARALYEQALARFRTLENQPGIASCLHDLAGLAADSCDYAAARRLYGESIKLYWDLGHRTDLPRLLEAFSACAVASGEPDRALTMAGGAAALRKELHRPLAGAPKTRLENVLEAARQQMGSSEATACWMRGWAMRPEDVVRFTLGMSEPG